nr:formyltransferase family protein [uncultured Allomuricauda sp.]
MDVVILTSNRIGSASLHLEHILKSDSINIKMVVLSLGEIPNKKKYFKRRFQKLRKVGILGAINGVRMRKWYTTKTFKYLDIAPIHSICEKHGVPFEEVPYINSNKTVELFKKSEALLGVSLGNPYIGRKIYNVPQKGMINLHYEELPQYQNAIGVVWQLYNLSSNTGYTIHQIDKHIDTGDILLCEKVPITFQKTLEDTVAGTYAKVWLESAEKLKLVLQNFDDFVSKKKKQENGTKYTTPTIYQFCKILLNHQKLRKNQLYP